MEDENNNSFFMLKKVGDDFAPQELMGHCSALLSKKINLIINQWVSDNKPRLIDDVPIESLSIAESGFSTPNKIKKKYDLCCGENGQPMRAGEQPKIAPMATSLFIDINFTKKKIQIDYYEKNNYIY